MPIIRAFLHSALPPWFMKVFLEYFRVKLSYETSGQHQSRDTQVDTAVFKKLSFGLVLAVSKPHPPLMWNSAMVNIFSTLIMVTVVKTHDLPDKLWALLQDIAFLHSHCKHNTLMLGTHEVSLRIV